MQIATADSWHETRTGSGGITYIGEPHTLEFCRCNIWRVKGGDADLLEEGDIVDLSDRHFPVLHIPGHSPGSISLREQETGILFSGDAVYDGTRIDGDYPGYMAEDITSTERLLELPVRIAHRSRHPSYDSDRHREAIRAWLDERARS